MGRVSWKRCGGDGGRMSGRDTFVGDRYSAVAGPEKTGPEQIYNPAKGVGSGRDFIRRV